MRSIIDEASLPTNTVSEEPRLISFNLSILASDDSPEVHRCCQLPEPEVRVATDEQQQLEQQQEKKKTIKNVILISIAFLLNFNAFQGLSRLQSSLQDEDGVGVATSAIVYGSLVISCMFSPKIMINFFGHKWTIAISFLGYIIWVASNGYPTWGTMIPSSIIVGVVAASLWTAQCSYFTLIGRKYAQLNNESVEATLSRFFGIFFMFFQMCEFDCNCI